MTPTPQRWPLSVAGFVAFTLSLVACRERLLVRVAGLTGLIATALLGISFSLN